MRCSHCLASFTLLGHPLIHLLHPITSSHLQQCLSSSSPLSPRLLRRTVTGLLTFSGAALERKQMPLCMPLCRVTPEPCSSPVSLHSTGKTRQVQSWGSVNRPIPRFPSWGPQPSTQDIFIPQPPKAPQIWPPESNLTTCPQSSSSEISLGQSEVFTFACAKEAPGVDVTGSRKTFSTRTKSAGRCPRHCTAQWELLRVCRFTQPHWEPNL